MLYDLMKSRRSVRQFTSEKISREIIDQMLEVGRLSPSGGNEQAWLFGVIESKELIDKISAYAYHQKWIKSAPLLIVLCTEVISDEAGGRNIQKSRYPMYSRAIDNVKQPLYGYLNAEEHQTKIPGTYMTALALEYGIQSTWISHFDVLEVKDLLILPDPYFPSEIIAFGYPKYDGQRQKRKNLEDIVFYNQYINLDEGEF